MSTPAPALASDRAVPRPRSRVLLAPLRLPRTGPAEPTRPGPVERADDHEARVGPRPRGALGVLEAMEEHGLRGHGGAYVPTALRWRRALGEHGALTVVANGAESEPVSAKDGTLMRQRPHLVLEGLQIAVETLGAQRAVVWLHGDDHGAHAALAHALTERPRSPGSGPVIELVHGPSHYLAGQSSAIARALQGGPALPTTRRPATRPGGPRTLVQNVETLARVALLARGHAPVSTAVLTVLLPDGRHVVEVDRSTPLPAVLAALGRSDAPTPRAVLLGGYGGQWVSWDRFRQHTPDELTLRADGLGLGAGVLAPLPRGTCGVAETASLVAYLAAMSARQCGPCAFGLPALAEHFAALAAGSSSRGPLDRLLADAGTIAGRGACHHPDGATRLVASAVTTFGDEIDAHVRGRTCPLSHAPTFPVPGVHT